MIELVPCTEQHVRQVDPTVRVEDIFMHTGPALSLVDNGKVLVCGGLRLGVAEAWMMPTRDFALHDTRTMLRTSRELLQELYAGAGVWEVFAVKKGADRLLEHLGFLPINNTMVTGIRHG